MNLANKLTILRMLLAFVFMVCFSLNGLVAKILSLVVFTLAALTDLFDGTIARKRNMITDFGKLMDPIADKILVLSAFAAFLWMQLIKDWMFMIIISRDILVTSLRLFALNKGKVLSAGKYGKGKTVSQMVVIFLILAFVIFKEVMKNFSTWNPTWETWFKQGIYYSMLIIVVLTVHSGFSYFWNNRKIITNT